MGVLPFECILLNMLLFCLFYMQSKGILKKQTKTFFAWCRQISRKYLYSNLTYAVGGTLEGWESKAMCFDLCIFSQTPSAPAVERGVSGLHETDQTRKPKENSIETSQLGHQPTGSYRSFGVDFWRLCMQV